ncbi:MAG: hypothetical protein AUJ85_03430 [Elusimicrobia bacterium CG1_02_37_114]|nr:MAG: hypothetical protein AUJ85_03430 [Elusimicrobia bacterium CG1_02_37_114]PIV53788.1 MAG: hypothetical protein COS17_02140 [Elusimicrobia bacterium CG02_land_8_20_14_3_00_37_13]PIZ13340.1 MAG: hypothetical protein COY53_05430 [Elusimicrobia bacterium CG_4_10_14_0_8_um_filter_37_32]
MKEIAYFRIIDYQNRIRVRFLTFKGRVTEFLIQYETTIGDKWHPVVRYDTSHNRVHRDLLFRNGTKTKEFYGFKDFGSALTFALEDLVSNWKNYFQTFEEVKK